MKTFKFPLYVQDGTLDMVSGDEAAQQVVQELTRTVPGELPLSRDYGLFVDYNIPTELAGHLDSQIRDTIQRWYPEIVVRASRVEFDDDGIEARVIVDVKLAEGS